MNAFEVKNLTPPPILYLQASGGIGRHEGLKILWPQGRAGSSPASPKTLFYKGFFYYNNFNMPLINKNYRILIFGLILIIAISAFFHWRLAGISDTDSFYHIKHSLIYRSEGLTQTAFPWTQYSVINKFSSDIWYGLHILTIPFTYFLNLVNGIKLGGFLITVISLFFILLALMRLKIKWPLFWLAIFALASPDLIYRLTMFRPHPLSLGIAALLFAYLVMDSACSPQVVRSPTGESPQAEKTSKTYLLLFIFGFFFSWIHLSLAWLPILIVGVISGARFLQKLPIEWRKISAVFSGLILGWLLRPNPFGAVKIAYVQIAQLFLEKDLPLRFGRELKPFVWENFVDQLIPISVLIIIAVWFFVWVLKRKGGWVLPTNLKTIIWSSFVLWAAFFYLTFSTARRSNEIFIAFAVIFIGLLFSHYLNVAKMSRRPAFISGLPLAAAIFAIIGLVYMPIKTVYRFDTYTKFIFGPELFKESSQWLKENSKPGEIVFNIHWDRFGQLFFYNDQNYYINGMDPIFQYAHNPSLYWKTHFFAIDEATAFTCGKIRCVADEVEDTRTVLKRDFKATYLILEKTRSPKLYGYLEKSGGFKKVFETIDEALYKIL